jgi:hypothetical protein
MLVSLMQFVAGGALTVLATRLSAAYGPKVGALIWVYPLLLYVSAVGMAFQGGSAKSIAAFCYASFPTTIVNAFSALLLGWLVATFPGRMGVAVLLSLVISTVVGYGGYLAM